MGSALGRPAMIHDVDCDVEPLNMGDFEPNEPPLAKMFVIEQCKLATIRKYYRSDASGTEV